MTLRTQHLGAVLVLRLDRPAKRNAVNGTLTAALDAALNSFEDDDGLRVAVLTGTGGAFCAGTDLRETAGPPTERGGEYGVIRRGHRKPMIAAVEGLALGGGMEIVLACDLVVAARDARFGLPEVRRGLIATCGGLFRTQRALPVNIAKQLALTGEPLGAERMYSLGLVNELTDPGGAEAAALTLADQVCANAPVAVRESLLAIERTAAADDAAAWQVTADAIETTLASADAAEGVAAFRERREPRWSGH